MRKLIIKIIKKQDGFTLVELLIILFLIGIVLYLGLLYFNYSARALERGEQKTIAQQTTRSTSDFITREIRFAKEIEINPEGELSDSGYNYIYLENNSIIFRDANENERVLADSDLDDVPYSIYFTSNKEPDDGIPEDIVMYYIIADYVLDIGAIEDALADPDNTLALEEILNDEVTNGLYYLKTKVIALNLELFRAYGPGGDLIKLNGDGGTVIKYKKP